MPEVRGGSFVEKQYGVGVTSQHGGWHALGDVVLHSGGHGPALFVPDARSSTDFDSKMVAMPAVIARSEVPRL
jgi:hypothetical protein